MDEKQRNKVLLVLFAGVLMGALDIAIVGPALPAIQKEFAASTRGLAWIFNIYVLFTLVGTPLMAKLSDRFGRRSIYIADVALFGAGSLLVASAGSLPAMVLGRAVQAIGAGGIFPVAAAVIGDTFPVEKRGSALGIIGAVFGLAFLVGPVLAGLILKYASWHWLFLINIPIGLALIVAAMRLLPATRPAQRKPFDLLGVSVLSVLLASLAYGLTGLDKNAPWLGVTVPAVGGTLLMAVLLAPIFWAAEKRAVDPVLRPSLMRSRQISLAGFLCIGAGAAETGTVFLPALAVAALGMKDYEATFWMLPAVLALGVGSPLAGRMLDRSGSRAVVLFGLLLTAAGLALLSLPGMTFAFFIVAEILVGLGLSALLGAPFRYIVLSEARPEERGAAQALTQVPASVGQVIGAAVVGSVAASMGNGVAGYQQGFLVVAVIVAVMFVLAFGLRGQAEERAATAASHADATTA
jgi:EmrB/QacA subfamily drug resistance transporter